MAGEQTLTAVKSFTCAACGAPVEIRAAGVTLAAVCSACGSTSEQTDGLFTLVMKAHDATMIMPRIPLGKKGKIGGKTFQVIGFMRRSEEAYPAEYWDEFLLFSPYEGFRWLFEYKGHWTLFKMSKAVPEQSYMSALQFLGEKYKIYHEGNAVVRYVIGEFYWRVRIGEKVQTMDAISPPRTLSQERSAGEIVWSVGTYLTTAEVVEAFHPSPMPAVYGVAPNQPALFNKIEELYAAWAVVFVFLFFIQIFAVVSLSGKQVDAQPVTTQGEAVSETEVAQIENPSSSMPILFEVSSSANQSWTTVELRLVPMDPENKVVHEFQKDLSYYSGYSDGESWAEGDQTAEFLASPVPRGRYRVLVSVTPEPGGHRDTIQTRYTLRPAIWSNFWLAFLLVSIPIGSFALRNRIFERKRWEESERNPFESHDNGGGNF